MIKLARSRNIYIVFIFTLFLALGTVLVGSVLLPEVAKAEEKALQIDLPSSALFIMHAQNAILSPKGKFAYSGSPAIVQKHNMIKKWATALNAARDAGMTVIHVHASLRPGYPEMRKKTYHLAAGIRDVGGFMRGTWDVDVPDELKPLPNEIIRKI